MLHKLFAVNLFVLSLVLAGCSHPTVVSTPNSGITLEQAKAAQKADQVVLRVNELQAAAISAEANKGLPTSQARIIVQFTVAANKTLATIPLPGGWVNTVQTAWNQAKPKIGPVTNPAVAAALGSVDLVLATLGGQS